MTNVWLHTETNKPGQLGDRPTVDSVRFLWQYDEHGSPDWLECGDSEYAAEDKARIDAFHNGDWHMEGCQAVATVSYPIDNRGSRRLQEFCSGGLWGIESTAGEDYRREVERDELADLAAHLAAFGIDTTNLDTLV